MKKKILALVLLSAMVLTGVTGCKDKDKKTTVKTDGNVVVTTAPSKPTAPGEEFKSAMGEEFNYEKYKMNIKLVELGQTAPSATDGTTCYAFVFSTKNNSDKDIKLWMLDDFAIELDGVAVEWEDMYSAFSTANAALAYEGYSRYDSTLEAGKSIEGIVPFQVSGPWEKMKIEYKPNSDLSNDYIVYELTKDDVTMKFEQ